MKNKLFNSALIRLTVYYVAILMSVSFVFSVVIYNVSVREITQAFEDINVVKNDSDFEIIFENINPDEIDLIPVKNNINRISQINNSILFNLLLFNFVVLGLGLIASYLLAKKTLDPINKSYQAQSQFTSDAAHELRTPLTAIKIENEIASISNNLSGNQMRDLLNNNLKIIDEMDSLITQLLILASQEKVDFESVNVRLSVEDVINKLSNKSKAKNIKIVNKVINRKVNFNQEYLNNLLTIFIDNAIKYSPEKSEIKITSKKVGSKLKVSVADQGRGIDKKDIKKVFDRFYRADKSRNKKLDGCGLGLSIAKKISDQYNLKLRIKSEKEIGTTVDFFLSLSNNKK